MYYFSIPNYLENKIKSNFQIEIHGEADIEVTGYAVYITRNDLPGFPYAVLATAEIFNKGDAVLEVLGVDSKLTNVNGGNAIRLDNSETLLRSVDTTYYDTLPQKIGIIIPPGEKLPIEIWNGVLMTDDPNQFEANGKEQETGNLLFYWNIYGLPLLRWEKLQATVVVRSAEESIVEWYQYWGNIQGREVQVPRRFWESCTYDLLAKIDPNPIFDNLVEKYGKGIPNPNGPGRIIIGPDGTEIQLHTFRPQLQFVVTFYDKNDEFIGGYRTVSLEKDPYEMVDADGYFQIGSNLSCEAKVKNAKVYLEIIP